jgi:hypothetical protein
MRSMVWHLTSHLYRFYDPVVLQVGAQQDTFPQQRQGGWVGEGREETFNGTIVTNDVVSKSKAALVSDTDTHTYTQQ